MEDEKPQRWMNMQSVRKRIRNKVYYNISLISIS
jgi:hypothetical protein